MSSNLVGQIVANQFRVDSFISSGGMGTVFRVWDLERNVPLAMKVLHTDLAEDQDILARFQREARALWKLEHPNIIPFYGLYQTPSHNLLLQLYIDGPTLKEVLGKLSGNTLPTQDILCIMKSLCSALGYAHNNKVIHCDVKPANVLIDRGGKVYLGDFGIARHAESDVTALPGAGSPAYMAPEQITSNIVSRETDIYSLGVLLFELLTGQRPFTGTETGSERAGTKINERIRYAHVNLPPPDPRIFTSSISPLLSTIVLRALHKDPTARFSTCQEFLLALSGAFNLTPDQIPDRISTTYTVGTTTPNNNPTVIQGLPGQIPRRDPIPKKKSLLYIGGSVILVILIIFLAIIALKSDPFTTVSPPSDNIVASPAQPTRQNDPPSVGFPQPTEPPLPTNEPIPSQPLLLTPTYTSTDPTATQLLLTEKPGETPALQTYYPFPDCPQSHLFIGDSAYVTYNSEKISLRSAPVGRIGDTLIRKLDQGEVVHVIDGPICDLNLVLWKVRTVQNEFGWLPEGDYSEFWILPIATENVCSGARPTRLWVGATAFVEPMPKERNIMYSEPTVDSSKELGRMNPGSFMQVLEGPSCGNGRTGVWWYVYSEQLKIEGWTRENSYSGDYYFIAPVIPRP